MSSASRTSSSATKPYSGCSSGVRFPLSSSSLRRLPFSSRSIPLTPSPHPTDGGGAPYQGQVNHFSRAAPEKIPYAITRFKNETLRVYGVLEIRLSGQYADGPREYLAGKGKGKYSVADIKTWPWVKGWERTGFTQDEMKPFPHLLKWVDRIAAREAVKKGVGEAYNQQ